jgi:hypothetical protein
MSEPPAWVYDLVIELIEQEELHPTLYFTSGAFEGYKKYDWCAGTALANIPPDVVEKAAAIRAYKAHGSDRWLDLNRLDAVKWKDKILDPAEVVYVLRGTE